MHRYDVVSGILFILSIIGFALAAPVLVQEKRQACIDVVHIPKDVITVLGKRGGEESESQEEFLKSIKKSIVDSSDTALTLAPPGYEHGSTSTANPNLLMESLGSTSTAPKEGSWEDNFNAAWDDAFSNKGDEVLHGPLHTPTPTEHGLDHELTGAHAPQPNPKKRPLIDLNTDWMNYDYQRPPTRTPAPPKEFDQAHDNQVEHVQQPNPPPRPASPKEFGQAHENQVGHVQQPNPGPSTDSDFDWKYWTRVWARILKGP